MADCLPCHFDYEEKVALPCLPMFWRRWLIAEHVRIRNAGYPAAEVLAHAEREMPIFHRYCPPHVVQQIIDDHERLSARLKSGQDAVAC